MARPKLDQLGLFHAAMRGGIDCTVVGLLEAVVFEAEHELDKRRELNAFLESWGLVLCPRMSEGTDHEPRVLRCETIDDFTEEEVIAVGREGEQPAVEFKETLLLDVRAAAARAPIQGLQNRSEAMILASLKTICGFLNNLGGELYVGLDAVGEIKGIERDFELLPDERKSPDGWCLKLTELIQARFIDGVSVGHHVEPAFCKTERGTVCRIRVTSRTAESFLRDGPPGLAATRVRCFVRRGTQTDEIGIEHMSEFVRARAK